MDLVLDDGGSDGGDFGDLMAVGGRVGAIQGNAAPGAGGGLAGDGVGELVRGAPEVGSPAGVRAVRPAFLPEGVFGRLTFEVDGVGRRRAG